MAIKGYKITQAVKDRLIKARKSIKPKIKNPNALKPNDSRYRGRMKKFRKSHKEFRNKCRKNNYSKSRPKVRKNRRWAEYEINMLIDPIGGHFESDSIIAFVTERSVQAIQNKRYLIKKEQNENLKT